MKIEMFVNTTFLSAVAMLLMVIVATKYSSLSHGIGGLVLIVTTVLNLYWLNGFSDILPILLGAKILSLSDAKASESAIAFANLMVLFLCGGIGINLFSHWLTTSPVKQKRTEIFKAVAVSPDRDEDSL